ncbi:uncharacterized protein LOC131669462 isoform X2 [Phymastichus coffea]|uniref:uncharacterized protein LOC131669462 isoform X2 n=1 Tax=Phymastichus coffea TaxID=108790 RepID=UPI00273B88A0|nr:uncharacterized protein LOC131669462 isoform X2 [Phymastichus coffea]
MNRYSDYARDLHRISNVDCFSSRATILPLREFPRENDPRRSRSYKKYEEIKCSREDQPLFTMSIEPYRLRRVIVPPTRSQYIKPSRIPNARDPRGLEACRKLNSRSKNWKYALNWVPTLVENDRVLQEEETCAILVIDVSEWESRAIKRSYIEIIPHECNVQRAVVEVKNQLAELLDTNDDDLLMTPEEAHIVETNIQVSAGDDRANGYWKQCESSDSMSPKEFSTVFNTIEDRPMLEINQEQEVGYVDKKVSMLRLTDEDENENRVVYEMDEELEVPPIPTSDETYIECIDIDTEDFIKKEPRLYDADVDCIIGLNNVVKNSVVPNESRELVSGSDGADVECIILDSDEEEPTVPNKESAQKSHIPFDKNLTQQVLDEVIIDDSDDEESDIMFVAMQLSMGDSSSGAQVTDLKQAEESVGFGNTEPTNLCMAHKTDRSSVSSNKTPTTMQLETLIDAHEIWVCDKADDVAHCEISKVQPETEETAHRANIPVAINTTQKRKRGYNERFYNYMNEPYTCKVDKRRKENNDVVNDESQSDNCKAVVERVPSPVFETFSRNRKKKVRKKSKPDGKVLQLARTSSCVITKSSTRNHHQPILFSNFSALVFFYNYLKNYTTIHNCLNFFVTNFQELSIIEFLRIECIQKNINFWRNRYDHWHHKEKNVHFIEPVHDKQKFVESSKNKVCDSGNKVLPKRTYIKKQVPELDLDDLVNRPLPQKIQFDVRKLSINLQKRVKKRNITVDSTIVSEYNDYISNLNKRRKLTNFTIENEQTMDNITNYNDRLLFNDKIKESLNATELPTNSCTEFLGPQSENMCYLNNNNNDITCNKSEKQNSSILQILRQDCLLNTYNLNEKYTKLNEKYVSRLENVNKNWSNENSSECYSDFCLFMVDKVSNLLNTSPSQDSNIEIDHNYCILQKDSNSSDETCTEIWNDQINLNEDSEMQVNSDLNNLYTKKVDRLNKKLESLSQKNTSNKVEKITAMNYDCNKYQTDEIRHLQQDGQIDNLELTTLQSLEEEQSRSVAVNKSCIKNLQLLPLNSTELSNSEDQQQQLIFDERDMQTDATHKKNKNIKISLNKKKNLTQEITSSKNQGKITTSKSSNKLDFQSNSLENIKHHQHNDYSDVQNSQALINNEKYVESNNVLESESNLVKENQFSVIFNDTRDSYCYIVNEIISKPTFHDEKDENFINVSISFANSEHSSLKEDQIVDYIKHKESGLDSFKTQKISDINTSSSLSLQNKRDIDVRDLQNELEEGDLDFHTSIHGINTHLKYNNNEYNSSFDDEKYENQVIVDTVDSNCISSSLEKANQSLKLDSECILSVSEIKHYQKPQKPFSKIINDDAMQSNLKNFIDIDKEGDDIIDRENISNESNCLKDDELNISNINNDFNVQVSETSNVPNMDITLENQSTVSEVSPVSLSMPSSHENDSSNVSEHLQTVLSATIMNSLDKSDKEIPVIDIKSLLSSTLNNSSTTPARNIFVSNEHNDQVLNINKPVNSTLNVKSTIPSSTNVDTDFNNPEILEKFNLTREIIAPEDRKAENSIAFENNDEEETLCSTLENMLKVDFGKKRDDLKVTNEQNCLNVEVPSASSLVKVSLLTGPNSENNYDLLKALNINFDDEVDVIADKTSDKSSHGVIKVKNLNEMLQKESNLCPERTTLNSNVLSENSPSKVPEDIQQNKDYSVKTFQGQSSLLVNVSPPNNLLNACIPPPSLSVMCMNQSMPAKSLQASVNMCCMASTLETTTDKQVVLASSIFPGMFDAHATPSFCNKTVFNLKLPPIMNIVLPPPYTILSSDKIPTISKKIQLYKLKLLKKIIETLAILENININIIRKHIEVLCYRQTLTEETWNIQEKILILAQCIESFKKLTKNINYSNIIKAIMGSIYTQVHDRNLLEKMFRLFQILKINGIFKSHSENQQPLTLELGAQLKQTDIGMSCSQKDVLEYQLKIYKEILKINQYFIENNRVEQSNIQSKNQNHIQRSSPTILQQNVITDSIPVIDIVNNSFQNSTNIQHVQSVPNESLPEAARK